MPRTVPEKIQKIGLMHQPHVHSFKHINLRKTLSRIHSVENNKKFFLLFLLSLLKQPPFFPKNMSYWKYFSHYDNVYI